MENSQKDANTIKGELKLIRNWAIASTVIAIIALVIIYANIAVSDIVPFYNESGVQTTAGISLFIATCLWIMVLDHRYKLKIALEQCHCPIENCVCGKRK